MEINFAKLNHVLIPSTKTARDRLRQGWVGRFFAPFAFFYGALSNEGRVAAVLAVVSGAFGQDVRNAEIYLLWCTLVGALAGSILVRSAFALDDVRIDAVVPKRVTVGEEIVFRIVLANDGARDHHAVRLHGPFLPWDGRWIGEWPRVRRLRPRRTEKVEMRARFVARGEHHLDPFRATSLVPFGLAQGRAIETGGVRFLVVPRMARVVAFQLPMSTRHQPGGVALASKTGESRDLLGVRPYRVGDPIRDLHARRWASLGQPVVREYQEEYFSRVGVVVDLEGAEERRFEAGLSLAAGVVAHLSRGEALIDLLVVGDRVLDVTLGRSLGFLEQALDLLACVEPAGRAAPRAAVDAEAILRRINAHLPRLSCVVLVTTAHEDGGLGERVRAAGSGFVVLRVTRPGESASSGRDTRAIGADAIERGEALAL